MAGAFTHGGNVVYGLPNDASQVNFNKTGTDLNATQTESAIKEVNTKANTANSGVSTLRSDVDDVIGWDNHKNLLPVTLENLKAANTDGTWSGNTYTYNNVTFTVNQDNNGSITGINVDTGSGSSSAQTIFKIPLTLSPGSYILSGCPSGGTSTTYAVDCTNINGYDYGDGNTFDIESSYDGNCRIIIRSNVSLSNKLFKLMVRLASDADPTFEPYHQVIGETLNELKNGLTNLGSLKCVKAGWANSVVAPLSMLTIIIFAQNTYDPEMYIYNANGNALVKVTTQTDTINATKSSDSVTFDSNNRGRGDWAVLTI